MSDQNSNEPEKLDLASFDIAAQKREELATIFPEVRTEGGKIDFERLKSMLGEQIDTGRERYGMTWPGKAECTRTIQSPSSGTLLPMPEESVDWDTTGNVIIEGDNLEVLKLLQNSYLGKVRMIYIDPPYNTGNDFIYPDNYSESLQTYLEYTGQVDASGRKFGTNTDSEGRFHSRWLNMMYPRLFLARNLLQDEGVICVSIDDGEALGLRVLLDQVFGEENFIAQLVWKSRQNKDNRNTTGVSIDHEYVLCYGRKFRGAARKHDQYTNPDSDPRGPWASANMVGMLSAELRPNCHYDLTNPETGIVYPKPNLGWRYDRKTMSRLVSEGKIIWPSDPSGRPRRKLFLSELKGDFTGFSSIIGEGIYTRNGSAELDLLMGEKVFDFPKPSQLLQALVEQCASEPGAVVLDFFAGSGSLGHAVLAQNIKDGIARNYIMVQLPETQSHPEYPTLSAVTRERARRAGAAIRSSKPSLVSAIPQDTGFRAFRLAPSNFIPWDGSAANDADQLAKQLQLGIEHTRVDRSPQDLLFEVLLKSWGEPALSLHIAEEAIEGVRVFSIADGAFLICLEEEVSLEFIRAIAVRRPDRVVMRESAFTGNDQLKANAFQTFKSAGVTSFKVV